jgi:hypothetical protein
VTRFTVIAFALLAGCSKKHDDKPAAQATGSATAGSAASGAANNVADVPGNPSATKAKVTVSKVTLDPAGDATPLSDAITKRMDELIACYQDALMSHDGEQGVVTLAFTIKPDGKLDDIAATSMLNDSSLETCYSDSFKSVKLDKPLGANPIKATVELTLSLQ